MDSTSQLREFIKKNSHFTIEEFFKEGFAEHHLNDLVRKGYVIRDVENGGLASTTYKRTVNGRTWSFLGDDYEKEKGIK